MALGAQVALTNSLPVVVLAGNPVPLKFEASTNLISSAGSKAEIILPWTAVAVNNEYFDLLLAGQTVRFTCKVTPDNSGTQFHDNSGGLTLANWVMLMSNDLAKNYLIARYYDIVVAGTQITLTAKEPGSAYSMEFTAGAGIDVVPTETNKNGTDFALEAFYYIVVLLYIEGEFITEILLNVDETGLAEVDVSRFLQSYLESSFAWPEKPGAIETVINSRPNMVIDWYVMYGERWGDGEYQGLRQSSVYHAISGGLSFRQLAKYNAEGTSFWAQMLANHYFLTWAPLTRKVAPQEPIKLYYINYSGATTISLVVNRYFADGSSEAETIASDPAAVNRNVYEFLLAVTPFVDFDPTALPDFIRFEVWVENAALERISEIRYFEIDFTEYANTRYFIFRNSLGAFEVIRATGVMSRAEDVTRESVVQGLEADFTAMDREEIDVLTSETRRFTASLGWLSRYGDTREMRNWLRDFALSKEVYMAEVEYNSSQLLENQSLVPIRIVSTSFDHGSDRDNLLPFSFEFVNAFRDEYFTKEITDNLEGESYADDFEKAQ
jgi:hypothetical protein